ncbi:SpoIIE family protein phosphatase [Streptantibioticus parmotrematis]|uniref:SpoIIE family protein phosphatase n=1 Tax=Streptantibioticus parmotrematis TaxID=2873249 RepID=UPI0027E061AE|nr:SpoIIE family protein phosphatase [Streptantibioticus parmotrematis]
MGTDSSLPLNGPLLRRLLEGTTAGIGVLDTELRYLYVNPALARMNGVPAEAHLGRTIGEILPALDAREDVLREVLADGRPRETTSSGHTRAASGLDRRYWHGAYHRLEEDGAVVGIVGIVLEVSASRQEQHDLERSRARLALLDTAVTRIGTTLDIDTTCAELADFLVPDLADAASVEILPPDATTVVEHPGGMLRLRRAALAALPTLREAAERLGRPGSDVQYQRTSQIRRSLETGQARILNLPTDAQLAVAAPDSDRVAAYRAMGMHSALVVPLTARGETVGTVTMVRVGDSPAFGNEDLIIAQDLAGRAAISLDNARRYTREHGIALELQRALLSEPTHPHPGVEVASRYLPAGRSALVGGDWYDTIRLPFGRTLLAMGDVMGHGVEAAVDMSNYRSMLRVVGAADLPPHRVLRQLDTMIAGSGEGRPATCLLALADPARGRISYSSAGHLPPAVLGSDGDTRLLTVPPGPPLGTGVGGYELVTSAWRPGSVLLLYTDGLVERRGEDIDASLARLGRLRLDVDGPLDALLDTVIDRLVTTEAPDDVAVLAARVRSRRGSVTT